VWLSSVVPLRWEVLRIGKVLAGERGREGAELE
jgi:hypothetical protein